MVAALLITGACNQHEQKSALPTVPLLPHNPPIKPDNAQPYYQGLIDEYRATLSEDRNNLAALIGLANAYFDTAQWNKAVSMYEHALMVDPRNADVRTALGTAYHNLGMSDKALSAYHAALGHDPGNLDARYNLGVLYADKRRDPHAAIRAWEELLKIAPGYPHAEHIRSSIAAMRRSSPHPQGAR